MADTTHNTTKASSRKNRSRKRKRPSQSPNNDSEAPLHQNRGPKSSPKKNKIFNGLILAISASESNAQSQTTDDDPRSIQNSSDNDGGNNCNYNNYKTLATILKDKLGATLSPQVHKRVHYLISTSSAVANLTQRVRQALKRNVDIIDVGWVKDCLEGNKRLDICEDGGKYLMNERVRILMVEREKEKANEKLKNEKNMKKMPNNCDGGDVAILQGDGEDIDEDNEGWSTPIQLDCCCVCHENGDDACPWCTECNITLAKKTKGK